MPCFALPQPLRDAVRVAQEEGGRVDEHAAAFFGLDFEAPEHRLRERLVDGAPFGRVGA